MKDARKTVGYLILFAVFILFLVIFMKSRGDFTYSGKNGDVYFDKIQIEKVKFFRPHINYNGQDYVYAFRNNPSSLEKIKMDDNIISNLNRPNGLDEVYITKDVNLSSLTDDSISLVTAPITSILGKKEFGIYKIGVRVAYTSYHAGQPTAYLVDCSTMGNEEFNKNSAVIYLKLGSENKIYADENGCIIIEGKNTKGLIQSGEKFAYSLLGIF